MASLRITTLLAFFILLVSFDQVSSQNSIVQSDIESTTPCGSVPTPAYFLSSYSQINSGSGKNTLPQAMSSTTISICKGSCLNITAVPPAIGNPPYYYTWNNGATGAGPILICPTSTSVYSYSITDAVGNSNYVVAGLQVVVFPKITAYTAVGSGPTCNGGSNGWVTITPIGGTAPYFYAWTPTGKTGGSISGLTAGSYTVVITDVNGCAGKANLSFLQPTALGATVTPTPISCGGGNSGSITASGGGSTPPYSYSWSNGVTGATINNLSAGTYTLTLTDVNGCSLVTTATVTQPPALAVTITSVSVTCNGSSNGSATATGSGGGGGYTYLWSNAAAGATANNLSQGIYSVTVTDASGCKVGGSVTIAQPTAITVTITPTGTTCGQANGSATASALGGAGGFTYAWSNGTNGTSMNNVAAGIYSLTVTDANGCMKNASTNISSAGSVTAQIISSTSVTCNGLCNGAATAGGTGGTTPYSYSWSSGAVIATANNLCTGVYSVTVTDATGCPNSITVNIAQPAALGLTVSSNSVLCNGASTGSATASGSGGAGGFQYGWNNGTIGATANNLAAGTYTVGVLDANGCTAITSVTINQPTALAITVTSTSLTCFGSNNGTGTGNAGGGTGTFTYAWSNAVNGATANNLSVGFFTVTATDGNGCKVKGAVSIGQPSAITITVSSTPTACSAATGAATAGAAGGAGGFTYGWSNFTIGSVANNLAAGTYSVGVMDANGCTAYTGVVITTIPGVTAQILSPTSVVCFGACTGSVTAGGTGGTTPYSYSWSNGMNSAVLNGLCPAVYTVTVSDANGCSSTATGNVNQTPLLTIALTSTSVICAGSTNGSITSSVNGGTNPYNYLWNTGSNATSLTGITLAGYTLDVTDAMGCTAKASAAITIQQLPVATFSADQTNGCEPLCVNFSNTTAGTTAIWNLGIANPSGNAVNQCYPAGIYSITITVTDAFGCSSSQGQANYINVQAKPTAAFSANPNPALLIEANVAFTDHSTGAGNWQWSFGDVLNSSSSAQNPTFTYQDTGTFVVKLIVSSTNGCSDTALLPVKVVMDYALFVPNTITPDDDGLNDTFYPVAIGMDKNGFEFTVFDRWGLLLFKTNDVNKHWNARYKGTGAIVQQDVYIWKIKCMDMLGNEHKYIGSVNVIK